MAQTTYWREFLCFMRNEKKWWLVPLGLALALVVGLILLSRSTAVGPFLYPAQ